MGLLTHSKKVGLMRASKLSAFSRGAGLKQHTPILRSAHPASKSLIRDLPAHSVPHECPAMVAYFLIKIGGGIADKHGRQMRRPGHSRQVLNGSGIGITEGSCFAVGPGLLCQPFDGIVTVLPFSPSVIQIVSKLPF